MEHLKLLGLGLKYMIFGTALGLCAIGIITTFFQVVMFLGVYNLVWLILGAAYAVGFFVDDIKQCHEEHKKKLEQLDKEEERLTNELLKIRRKFMEYQEKQNASKESL